MFTVLDISSNTLDRDSGGNQDASGVIAIADAISNMKALSTLSLITNDIPAEQQGTLTTVCRTRNIALYNLIYVRCSNYELPRPIQ